MPDLDLATREDVRAILTETHALWSEGMAREQYIAFVIAQMESPWGRENFRYLVWRDGEQILSSMKLYRLEARSGARALQLGGIGAVYTLRAHRGRGHARAMLAAALELLRREGYDGALLFSDIGWDYYRELGFHPLPSHGFSWPIAAIPLRESSGCDVEPLEDSQWPQIERLYESATADDPFVLCRSSAYWEQIRLKERERLRRLGARAPHPQHVVIRRGREILGYALLWRHARRLILLEVILAERSESVVSAFFSAVRRLGQSEGDLFGWWPPCGWSSLLPSECARPRTKALAMIAPLRLTLDPAALAACGDLFWATDHF